MYTYLFSSLLLLYSVCGNFIPQYELKFVSVKNCAVPIHDLQEGFSLDAHYEDGKINVTLNTPFDIDQNVDYHVDMEEEMDGEWVPIVDYQKNENFCTDFEKLVRSLPIFWNKLKKHITEDISAQCPLAKGAYHLVNFSALDTEIPTTIKRKIHYRLKFTIKVRGIALDCKVAEIISKNTEEKVNNF